MRILRFGGRVYKIEDVKQIASLGLDFAEISPLFKGDLICPIQDLQREAEKWGLSYLVHGPSEGDPFDLERLKGAFFQEIIRLLDFCRELPSPVLTVHFWMDRRFLPEEVFERKREILSAMAKEASKKEVVLCLETLSERNEDLRPLFTGCPELCLTLDIGHMQLLSERNRSFDILRRWPERVRHVHAHDNRGGNGVEDDLHLPIGEGVIDFSSIFRALIDTGYRESVTLEVPSDHLDLSVQKLRQIVNSMVGQ
jgi:sugar phosphate isomerase/epimerase